MKKIALFVLSFVVAAQVQAQTEAQAQSQSWDGCYQLVEYGVMYPAICFQGTEEEGINGSNVRLFSFRTNTSILDVCATGTVTKMTKTELVLEKNGIKEVVLSNYDGKVADAKIDGFPAPVKAVRLSGPYAEPLLKNAKTDSCK